MTQEDKELLLKDLCERLPYGVKFTCNKNIYIAKGIDLLVTDEGNWEYAVTAKDIVPIEIDFIKPYLFPMSSMTDEPGTPLEINKYGDITKKDDFYGYNQYTDLEIYSAVVNWLNKNHFDYHGLIDKSLALDATGLNIYN